MERQAEVLKKYCDSLLKGDFSGLPKVEAHMEKWEKEFLERVLAQSRQNAEDAKKGKFKRPS